MNIREAIEYFHLSFCLRLAAKIDRKFFCLKGGCNLRFYYQSIRYSEDIDFDVHTASLVTLKKNVEKILKDPTFNALLKHKNIELTDWSASKQTETTQRWKVAFRIGGQLGNLHTKLEFSRRLEKFEGGEIAPVHPPLITHYQLQTVLLQHYQLARAIEQKVGALVGRAETQARDVLDLKILKDQLGDSASIALAEADRKKALEALSGISFDEYKSQVWPYLIAEYQDFYGKRETWDHLQDEIFKFIAEMPRQR